MCIGSHAVNMGEVERFLRSERPVVHRKKFNALIYFLCLTGESKDF